MVDITDQTVQKIAKLSHIEIQENEVDMIANKLSHIIGWVEQLNEVNTDNIIPMSAVISMPLKQRQDIVTDGGYPDVIVKNTSICDGNFFCVPKVIE